jgi:hypothetical protein
MLTSPSAATAQSPGPITKIEDAKKNLANMNPEMRKQMEVALKQM